MFKFVFSDIVMKYERNKIVNRLKKVFEHLECQFVCRAIDVFILVMIFQQSFQVKALLINSIKTNRNKYPLLSLKQGHASNREVFHIFNFQNKKEIYSSQTKELLPISPMSKKEYGIIIRCLVLDQL